MKTKLHQSAFSGQLALGLALVAVLVGLAPAASPSPEDALALAPVQEGVDYDRPEAAVAARCTISAERINGNVGWIVSSPEGVILRKFVDTNGDNRVDRWGYYRDGIEIYRDIDTDFNRKVDQCRWFNTAGSRWGIDRNEDGQIDQWKVISAEEAAAEAVAALAAADWHRMQLVTLSPDEAKSLGLGKEKLANLLGKLATLEKDFQTVARSPKALPKTACWLQSTGGMPGSVPEGTDGSTKDLTVHENTMAVVRTDAGHGQLLLGTLVRVGDAWRLIDVPRPMSDDAASAAAGFFFASPAVMRPKPGTAGPDQAAQALLAQIEEVDKAIQKASDPKQQAALQARRADLLEQVAEAAGSSTDRVMWYHQLADTITDAIQNGAYPEGAKRLGQLHDRLAKNPADKDLAAYVRFRQIMADYVLSYQVTKPDYEKIQKTFIENLEKYVEQYPRATETPEAILQMAMTLEFIGEEERAVKWHERIVADFPNTPQAAKAQGARTRLDSVGKRVAISGKTTSGDPVSLDDFRGKAVLVQYWATWCEPAKADMAALKELVGKYRGQFRVLGVSLDSRPADLAAYLKENPLPWPQIFETGGLDSRPANQLGILTVPTMILIDAEGKVVNRNISVAELDKELKTMLR
ncbi:MAG: redoxin domain-containing protein [Pirellulales bacterium]|nr:redoxin domain-containing protein [Pirellulales bacterium]